MFYRKYIFKWMDFPNHLRFVLGAHPPSNRSPLRLICWRCRLMSGVSTTAVGEMEHRRNCRVEEIPIWGTHISHLGKRKIIFKSILKREYVRSTPHPVAVTTRIITFLVGNPYKPSFATVTGWGVDPRNMLVPWRVHPLKLTFFEPKNHPIEKENHLNPTSMTLGFVVPYL